MNQVIDQTRKVNSTYYSVEGDELKPTYCIKCGDNSFSIYGHGGKEDTRMWLVCNKCGWGYKCSDFSLVKGIDLGLILDCFTKDRNCLT